jgi:hypothetical protein
MVGSSAGGSAVSVATSELSDVSLRGEHRGRDDERRRIERAIATWLQRAVANTVAGDVAGLGGVAGDPVATVAGQAARRAAPWRRALDELASVTTLTPGTGRPWVPTLTAPPAAGPQTADKTELPSGTITVTGSSVVPQLVGLTTNCSLPAWSAGEPAITALMVEAALKATVEWVLAQLAVGAGAATSIAEAVGLLEAAGWSSTHVLGPASALLGEDLQRLALAGLVVVPVATADGSILVVSQPGVWVGFSEAVVQATEPSIGGMAVGAFCWAVASPGAGAVAVIAGGP